MNALFLAALMGLLQPGTVIQAPAGFITGTLRTTNGSPAVYIRVAAMRAPDSGGIDVAADAGALFSQTQTDHEGRYRLEGIPPGRYYVVAGRLDDLSFYPASPTSEPAVISIASGAPVENIDFAISDSSASAPISGLGSVTEVPFRIVAEDGGPIPLASASGRLQLNATATPGPGLRYTSDIVVQMANGGTYFYRVGTGGSLLVPGVNGVIRPDGRGSLIVAPEQYRLSLLNLPDNFEVRSMTYNGANVVNAPFRFTVAGAEIHVVIGRKAIPNNRITVRGQVMDALSGTFATAESVRLSGTPGTVFSDGSYEFTGVVRGRYILEVIEGPPGDRKATAEVTVDGADVVVNGAYTTRPAAITLSGRFVVDGTGALSDARVLLGSSQQPLVAERDGTFKTTLREGEYPLSVSIRPVSLAVKSIVSGSTPLIESKLPIDGSKGANAPELVITVTPIPRVTLRARVSATPPTRSVEGAAVILTGLETHRAVLAPDGTFELQVLPGTYNLEVYPFGSTTVRETIIMEAGKVVNLELTTRPLD